MKKKTVVKIVLDVLMIAAAALMYSTQALGLAFHEIGGLVLIGTFFVHKGLNFQWIRRVTVKLPAVRGRTRLMWVLDALMLVSFLMVGVSGILISKIALPQLAVAGGPWRTVHYSAAALSLVLVGVHAGLHYNYLKAVLCCRVRLPRVAAIALAAVIFAYGVYGIASTGFTRWLLMPFTASAQGGEGFRGVVSGQFPGVLNASDGTSSDSSDQAAGGEDFAQTSGTSEISGNSVSAGEDSAQGSGSSEITGNADSGGEGSAQTSGSSEISGNTASGEAENGSGYARRYDGGFGAGNGPGFGGQREQSGSAGGALVTLMKFFSIAFVFAAPTAMLSSIFSRKKRQAAA